MSYKLKLKIDVPEFKRTSIRQTVRDEFQSYIEQVDDHLFIDEEGCHMWISHPEYGVFLQACFSMTNDRVEIEGDAYDVGLTISNIGLENEDSEMV